MHPGYHPLVQRDDDQSGNCGNDGENQKETCHRPCAGNAVNVAADEPREFDRDGGVQKPDAKHESQ